MSTWAPVFPLALWAAAFLWLKAAPCKLRRKHTWDGGTDRCSRCGMTAEQLRRYGD